MGMFSADVCAGHVKDQEIALRIANTKMESVRAGGYAAVPSSGPFSDTLLGTIPSGTASISVANSNAQTKQVTVTVSWNEPAIGDTRFVVLSTLITDIGGL